jgi:hypothetical protein
MFFAKAVKVTFSTIASRSKCAFSFNKLHVSVPNLPYTILFCRLLDIYGIVSEG